MKKESKSEKLLLESQQEENDLKAMGKYKKYVREKRSEQFEGVYLPMLKNNFNVNYDEKKFCYTIDTAHKNQGIIDFYPKSNKIFFHNLKKTPKKAWKSEGKKWIMDYLICE